MDFLSSLIDFGLNAFGKSGGIPAPASGITLIGSLLYQQYENELPSVFDIFMGGADLDASYQIQQDMMAEKLDMTPNEFQEFLDSNYQHSLDEVARWKHNHPDPMEVLVDMVMERTGGK